MTKVNNKKKVQNYRDLKKDFEWFKHHKDLVYLDNAATTLKPNQMIKKVQAFNEKINGIYDNQNKLNTLTTKLVKQSKKLLSKFLEADEDEVFYTSGSTLSLNIAADLIEDTLKPKDEIIVHYIEHGSNLLPWFKLKTRKNIKLILVGKDDPNIDTNTFKKYINKNTKVVAFTGASNLLGNLVDTKSIIAEIKAINPNTYTVVDATQQLEHFPALCHETNCDFLVGSAHKIIGPTGLGFLYIKKDIQEHFNLSELNEMNNNDDLNTSAIVAFNESLKYWIKLGYEEIRRRETLLKQYFLDHINRERIELYTPSINSPMITFNMLNNEKQIIDAQDIEYYLNQHNILARSSLSCAKLAKYPLKTRNVVRVSLLFYNDFKDIDKLINIINNFNPGDELNGLI